MKADFIFEKMMKCTPIFLILVLGFVMRCELFHQTMTSEISAVYPAMECEITKEQLPGFVQKITSQNLDVAIVGENRDSELKRTLIVYVTNDKVKQELEKTCHYKEGSYESLFSGSVQIEVKQLSQVTYDVFRKNSLLTVIDGKELAYEVLSKNYTVTYPQQYSASETDMLLIVWVMIAICVVLINVCIIVRKKKQMLIRAIYGEDLLQITIYSLVVDFILFQIIYVLAGWFVSGFIQGDYKSAIALLVYEIAVIAASLCNLLFLRPDIKAVFSNVVENKGTITLLHVMKVAAFTITLGTIVTNFETLGKLSMESTHETFADQLQESLFVGIQSLDEIADDTAWEKLQEEYYNQLKPAVCTKIADEGRAIILANEYAADVLPQEIVGESESGNMITIWSPKGSTLASAEAEGICGLYVDEEDICQKTYQQSIRQPCLTGEETQWFGEEKDPIIIYCPSDVRINIETLRTENNVIYRISKDDLKTILRDAQITSEQYQIVVSGLGEIYDYQMSFVKKLIRFLGSLCILVLILDVVIAITLCNMQYKMKGMEYAIKKVHGYSFLERNRRYFIQLIVPSLVVVTAYGIAGLFVNLYNARQCILIGLILIITEIVIVAIYMLRQEKISITKILKGGCL
ncbi:hypothetical protein SAMN02910417_01697 [Eubacterium oxidoreducens]|uniref:Bacteriocin-associated integral membrane (Putative immunity) protein n=2 Tax=Eubacterium oxidoreducens TaxID=1732 RepID=A0A1G6BQW2_EUBOX|nr:hypothetical protein SAMN02910417_01697 [Eubacterium oxidoreducens]